MRNAHGGLWLAAVMLCAISARAEQTADTLIRVNSASGFERYWMVSEIRRSIDHVMEFNPNIPNARQYAPIYQSQYRRYAFVIATDGAPGVLGKVKSYLDDVLDKVQAGTMEQRIERIRREA